MAELTIYTIEHARADAEKALAYGGKVYRAWCYWREQARKAEIPDYLLCFIDSEIDHAIGLYKVALHNDAVGVRYTRKADQTMALVTMLCRIGVQPHITQVGQTPDLDEWLKSTGNQK